MNNIRDFLLDTLSERNLEYVELLGIEDEYNELKSIIMSTLEHGHSNSVLLQGGRASGKTVTLRKVLLDLKSSQQFIQINLNGHVHTDDRLAISEIYHALCKDDETENIPLSVSNHMLDVLEILRQGNRDNVPLLIILEEFDLFAGHGRQNLLYNLFDACQSKQHPMVVIGLSCRMDCIDLLEKRVKSRFSNRIIHFHGVSTFPEFLTLVENSLYIPPCLGHPDFNEHITEVVLNDSNFLKIVRKIFDLTKDIREFYRIAYLAVCNLSDEKILLDPNDFYEAYLEQRVDGKAQVLEGVSMLELCLIIAMKRLIDSGELAFNFEMIYKEYKEFALKNASGMMECYSKAVSFKAFENLLSSELVEYTGSGSVLKGPKEFQMAKLLVHPQQILEVVLKYRDIPTSLQLWTQ